MVFLEIHKILLYYKRDPGTGVSCEFREIFKNTFFKEHLWTTASGRLLLHSLQFVSHSPMEDRLSVTMCS